MTVLHDDMGGEDKPGQDARKRKTAWVPAISHVTGLFLITSVCGFVDAACFLSLGQVFAEMMTGNLLLFCFYIGTGYPLFENVGYLVALAAFTLGAITGGRINRGPLGDTRFGFGLEGLFLFTAVALTLAIGVDASHMAQGSVVALLAFAMGLQNALLRKHGVPDLATNVMTLTMTALFSDSPLSGGANERWQRRAGSVGVFMASALTGAFLTIHIGPWAPLLVAAVLFALALCGLTRRDGSLLPRSL